MTTTVKPASCLGCPLYDKPMVWGAGNPNASLMIVGQNPGPDEVKTGLPFTGFSGEILNRTLQKGGGFRSQAFVTNVVKCFVPPGVPVPAEAVHKCKPLLNKDFDRHPQTTTVLALGKEAFDDIAYPKTLNTIHNRKKSRKDPNYWLRGCPIRVGLGSAKRPVTLVPTVHPAFVARTGFILSDVFTSDVAKVIRFAINASVLSDGSYDYNPTDSQVRDYVALILERGEGGVDIETPESQDEDEDELAPTSFLPVAVIGLSAEPYNTIGVKPSQYRLLEPLFGARSGEPPNRALANANKPILWAYGSGFDFHHLKQHFSMVGFTPADGLSAFHLYWPDAASKDLGTAMSFLTDMPFHKNLQDYQPDYYNAADTWGALALGQEALRQFQLLDNKQDQFEWVRQSITKLFWNHMMPIIEPLTEWSYRGANCNTELAMRLEYQLKLTLEHYERWWNTNIPLFSWSSPKQLIELFTALGYRVPKRKRVRKDKSVEYTPSMDDAALEDIAETGNQTAQLVRTMRELRHASDFLGIYDERGRITCRAKPHGQVGGRIQTVDVNMQTIPEEIAGVYPRNIVIPDTEQDLIISADFSQIEFWLYAWYSKCKRALEIKESGAYLYGAFYEQVWGEPFFKLGLPNIKANARDDIPPWKLLVAKSWPLGFTYGRGDPDPDDQGLPIDSLKAHQIREQFFRDFPEFERFHRLLSLIVSRRGYLQTAFGRIRRFPNPKGQRNEINAFPGQTTAVDVLIRNVIKPLSRMLPEFGGDRSRILFTVHDSAICNITVSPTGNGDARLGPNQATRKRVLEAYELVKSNMEAPIPEMDNYVIPATIKLSTKSWGQGVSIEKFMNAFDSAAAIPDLL